MSSHADKTRENKSQSVANEVARKQSGEKSTFQFVDNRPEAIAQRELQEMADSSPQAMSMQAVQQMADNSTQSQKQALAYTWDTDIHVEPGQEKHLPHDAWHVVQQSQGRMKPTIQAKGTSVNDDASLEDEADVIGHKALQITSVLSSANTGIGSSNESIQFISISAIKGTLTKGMGTGKKKRGIPDPSTFDSGGRSHSEVKLLRCYSAGDLSFSIDGWPCNGGGDPGCHSMLIGSSGNRTIIVTVTGDSGGYAADHPGRVGAAAGQTTGTITYAAGAATYS